MREMGPVGGGYSDTETFHPMEGHGRTISMPRLSADNQPLEAKTLFLRSLCSATLLQPELVSREAVGGLRSGYNPSLQGILLGIGPGKASTKSGPPDQFFDVATSRTSSSPCPIQSQLLLVLQLQHPHTVPADGAVGVKVEGHQSFWTCDYRPFILVLTTVPPHTDSLGVSTKTKAGLVTEDDPLPF
ncbi:hypothetical protein NFI96_001210 [Prochilodus magdalenae]|nr:hypothetical protein NFI96_001210 [Prochilodus magdalenae]